MAGNKNLLTIVSNFRPPSGHSFIENNEFQTFSCNLSMSSRCIQFTNTITKSNSFSHYNEVLKVKPKAVCYSRERSRTASVQPRRMAPSFSRDEDSSLFDLLQAERNTEKALKHEGMLTPPKNQLSICTFCAKQMTSNDVHQSQLFRDNKDSSVPSLQMPGSVLTFLKCSACERDHVLWALNTWWDVKAILYSADVTRDGLLKVQTHAEKLALFILSQVCHNQLDYDTSEKSTSPFLPPNAQELGKIMWEEGEAIGFYTLLPAGTQIHAESSHDSYALPVVDTVYIREQYRGQGKCAVIVDDVVKTYPSQDIGFSDPISQSLLRVLEKYLEKHPECRDHMWEASYSGDEGYRRNIWLHIRRLKRMEGKSSSSRLDKLTS